MVHFFTSALWVCVFWLHPAAADEDYFVVKNGGSLQQLTCVNNMGSQPVPASTITYEVGNVQTNEESKSQSLEDMHKASVEIAYKYGFSEISSLELKASYTYQHKETTTTSEMTSSTMSEKLTLRVPVVGPQSTWCAYRLQSMSWPSGKDSKMNFLFKDIIITNEKLDGDLTKADLVFRGTKQKWDDPRGYLFSTMQWGKGDNGWFMYMQDKGDGNVRAWKGDPGVQGHLLFTKLGDTSFLISAKKWPNWYVYMQDKSDGNVRGWGGDPGPQGHFLIKAHPYKSCYLLSTKQWPDWYVYMQDTGDGNIRGWEGDPGDQGCWDMIPAWTSLSANTSVLVV